MKTKRVLLFGFALVTFAFYTKPGLFMVPASWPNPVYSFSKNPLSKDKIELGRLLFYDPILSRNNTISCASCHSPFSAFAHVDHALSHGIDDKIGTRNAPALMNLAWQKTLMWDGAVNHLDMQPLAPIHNPLEMDNNITQVTSRLQASRLYPKLFLTAYGDSIITGERILKTMSQFLLTLVSSDSRYDSVMRKQTVFTPQQNRGYQLFKKNCAACHTEPLFTNNELMNNGLAIDTSLRDVGRYAITKMPGDSLKFKVPSLRNIEFSYPYMHDGRFKRLSEVLNHYSKEIVRSKTLARTLQNPMILTSNEKTDIIAFLHTLTDRHFLLNPRFSYPLKISAEKTKDRG